MQMEMERIMNKNEQRKNYIRSKAKAKTKTNSIQANNIEKWKEGRGKTINSNNNEYTEQ